MALTGVMQGRHVLQRRYVAIYRSYRDLQGRHVLRGSCVTIYRSYTGSSCSIGRGCVAIYRSYRLTMFYGRAVSPSTGFIQARHSLRENYITTFGSYTELACSTAGLRHHLQELQGHVLRKGCVTTFRNYARSSWCTGGLSCRLQELQGRHVLREGCVTAFRSRSLINNAHGSPETKPVFAEKKRKTFTCFITVIRNSN